MPDNILLGEGVFTILSSSGATPVDLLCRGGGEFRVDREFRRVVADGDRGAVVGRIRKVGEEPHLVLNSLELPTADLAHLFSGTAMTTANSTAWTPLADLTTSHYLAAVYFTGEQMDGTGCVITIFNAVNLEPISLPFADKSEVVPKIDFLGCYTSSDRTTPPWSVAFTTS